MTAMLWELAKAEKKNFEGYWTFAHSKDLEWVHEPFETKAEAVAAGQEVYPCGFAIGQLQKIEHMVYDIVDVEKLTFS